MGGLWLQLRLSKVTGCFSELLCCACRSLVHKLDPVSLLKQADVFPMRLGVLIY